MMKTKLLLMLLVTVGLMAGLAQANMLVNPSFEEGAEFTPDDWAHYYTSFAPMHTWVDSTAGTHSGSKYMKMYNWLPYGLLNISQQDRLLNWLNNAE